MLNTIKMRLFSWWAVALMACAVFSQKSVASCLTAEVLSIAASQAQGSFVRATPTLMISEMMARAAIRVCETVSQPLSDYEVGLKKWRGDYSEDIFLPSSGFSGNSQELVYDYNPDTGVAHYTGTYCYYWPVGGDLIESFFWTDNESFPFSVDNTSYSHMYYPSGGGYHNLNGWALVESYYVKRNGGWYFGRPVRAHVTGWTWLLSWNGNRPVKNWDVEYMDAKWVWLDPNSWTTFQPWVYVHSTLGHGYATTGWEIL